MIKPVCYAFRLIPWLFLVSCGTMGPEPVRYYKGIVLDTVTKRPIPNATVEAYEVHAAITHLAGFEQVDRTKTGKDGRFEFVCTDSSKNIDSFSVFVPWPVHIQKYLNPGNVGYFGGSLYDVSSRHLNTILVTQ